MPRATVTVREIKNKETCLDVAVVSYREVPASFMRSTYEFQIVVVSSLSCFKLPSHRESDVVQFAIYKKFNEFEELRDQLNEAYAGTVFPPLEKKSIMVNETVLKERRKSLDIFMKFLAAAPRIATCRHVLAFLEVDPQKVKHFSAETDEMPSKEVKSESQDETDRSEEKGSASLFEEVDEDNEDFLAVGSKASGNEITSWSESIDFFSATEEESSRGARLFEVQDLKHALTEEDEKIFSFIPDAIIKKQETVTSVEEDSGDLLNIGDDYELEELVRQNTVQKQQQQKEEKSDQQLEQKQVPAKPTPPQKPTIAAKPKLKPPVPSRPTSGDPDTAGKPAVPQKPVPAPRKLRGEALKSAPPVSVPDGKAEAKADDAVVPAKGTDLTTDDIMSYIAANTVEEESVDLFS